MIDPSIIQVVAAKGELSVENKALLELYVQGMKYEEIADLLGVTKDAVRGRIYRMVERLRERISKEGLRRYLE